MSADTGPLRIVHSPCQIQLASERAGPVEVGEDMVRGLVVEKLPRTASATPG